MIEMLSKLSGLLKASGLPLVLLLSFHSAKVDLTERTAFKYEDTAPGDNFPYFILSRSL